MLGGKLTATAVNGVATFTGLTVSAAGAGYVLQVTAVGLLPASSQPFTVTGPVSSTSSPGPTLEPNPQIVKHKGALAEIILRFSEPMSSSSIENTNNYMLADAGSDHIFGNKNDRKVTIKSASPSGGGESVTLTLKKPDSLKDSIRLTIVAGPPSGVAAADGQLLNSSASGAAGANDVIYFGKPPKPPKPPKKGKKPKASVLDRHASGRPEPRSPLEVAGALAVAGPRVSASPQPWFVDALLDHAGKTGKSLWR